jgi:large subunit ribosomal protein L10
MNREEKAAVVEEIAAQIEGADAIFAIDYRGISVPQAAELRSRLREADASFRVVKNRLTKLAAEASGQEELKELLDGPTALTFVRGDTATAAKAISTFNREHEVLTFKGGFMEGQSLDEQMFTSIARLPARDVLNGQFAGVVASPLTGLVRGLGSLLSGLAMQLGQIAEQGLVSGEAPAEEATGDESPAEEAPAEAEPEATESEQGGADPPAPGRAGAPGREAEEAPLEGEEEEAGGNGGNESPSEEASQSDSSPTSEGDESPETEKEEDA